MNIIHKRMIKHLPKYERSNKLIVEILRVIAIELNDLNAKTDQSYSEMFIDTAIKALALHERDLNIEKGTLNNQQRRELITAHYRAILEQTTDETIKNVTSAFANGEVEINPTDTEGLFEVKFVSVIGIPDNMQGLMNTLDVILPAHLDVIYTYIFNTHQYLQSYTHAQLATFTHKQLREDVLP